MNRVAGRRARFVLGTAVLVAVAAACQPVTPPPPPPQPAAQACVGSTPVTPTDYQSAFDHLRLTYTEWASADGSIPIALPGGRTAWMFGDTFVGKVDPGGAIDSADPLIHNSFVVQTGACFAPLMGGAPLGRREFIPNPAPNQWYWPASAVVVNNTLQVFAWRMQQAAAPLFFTPVDFEVATFTLPSLQLQSVQPLPFGFNAASPYGTSAFVASGDVYLYGTNNKENVYVARAPLTQILTANQWQFWNGTADPSNPADPTNWVSDPTSAQPTTWANTPARLSTLGASGLPDEAPAATPWVLPSSNGSGSTAYFATAKSADVFSSDVSVFTAPDPWGPFTYVDQVASTPPNAAAPDVVAYGAFSLNPTSSTDPMIVYSTNVNPFAPPSQQPAYTIQDYGPNFVAPTTSLP
jgi:hypothetical protein